MEKKYWIGRKRAGRYSVWAAQSWPFMLPREGPSTEGERAALRLPLPARPRPGSIYRKRIDPRDWGLPEGPAKDGR